MSVIRSSGVSTLQGILVLKVIEICSRHSELSFILRVEGCPLSGVQLFDKCMCHPNMIVFYFVVSLIFAVLNSLRNCTQMKK